MDKIRVTGSQVDKPQKGTEDHRQYTERDTDLWTSHRKERDRGLWTSYRKGQRIVDKSYRKGQRIVDKLQKGTEDCGQVTERDTRL